MSSTSAASGGEAMRKDSAWVDKGVTRARFRRIMPAVILLAAGLQIVGSFAAWPQDASIAPPTFGNEPDAASSGEWGSPPKQGKKVKSAVPEVPDLKCPSGSCGGAGSGEIGGDPEFAQAVNRARELMGWLAGAGRTESLDRGNRDIPSQNSSPPLDGPGAAGTAARELAGNLQEMDGAGQESAVDARTAVGFGEPERDPVTEWKAALLEESGLLARQSEISESILLMERQVKQAELIARLMEINGPDAAIEIAPGRFKVFRDTPAGRRIAAEMAENGLDSQKRMLELQVEIKRKRAELEDAVVSKPVPPRQEAAAAEEEQVLHLRSAPEPVLEEIFGTQGRLAAIFRVGGMRVSVIEGDVLPGGALVVAVSENSARIERNGIERTHALDR